MSPTRLDLETAVAAYWATKEEQAAAAEAIQSTSEGTAKAVRGGGHFAAIAALIARFFLDAGYPAESIAVERPGIVLPGYFRPTKRWDLTVLHCGVLVAAIELKGIGGDEKSIGKNYNNRLEEALGNSLDVNRSYDSGLAGIEKPWLGYFFVMEDNSASRQPKMPELGVMPSDPVWRGKSQQERFSLTAERLLAEGLYDAVCFVTSSAADPGPREPSRLADWQHFAAAIEARLTYLRELGYPRRDQLLLS